MSNVRIKLTKDGPRKLRQLPAVEVDLRRRAEQIAAAAAGEGFEADSQVGRTRARASVRTATTEARLAEAKHRALTNAIDAGRR